MNDRIVFNVFLVMFSCCLYLTGILYVLLKLLVRKGLYVFNYHGFSTFENDYWKFGSLFVSNYQRNFERQVLFYKRHMRRADTFDVDALCLDAPKYFLTFDDGYKDNHRLALPVLKKYSIPSVFFIATGPVGTNRLLWYDEVRWYHESQNKKKGLASSRAKKEMKSRLKAIKKEGGFTSGEYLELDQNNPGRNRPLMMNWDEIREALDAGVLIGAHSHTHPILAQLDAEGQKKEIRTSIEEIGKNLNQRVSHFAYPQGDRGSFNQETIRLLESSGIRYAFTTIPGVNKRPHSPYCLKRIGIKASDPVPVVALKIIVASFLEK